MRVGTKSVLWGVHCFWWHWLTVYLAWRRVHGVWPNWWQTVAIFCHDLAYWGKTDMDGPSGIEHPRGGADLAFNIVGVFNHMKAFEAYSLCLYHSSTFARLYKSDPSRLYLPDKVSLIYDPRLFYLLRARLSGELAEYKSRNPKPDWYAWYRSSVQKKLNTHEKISNNNRLLS